MIKVAFCNPKKLADNDVWVLEVLSTFSLNIEQFMYVQVGHESNACATMVKLIDVNP